MLFRSIVVAWHCVSASPDRNSLIGLFGQKLVDNLFIYLFFQLLTKLEWMLKIDLCCLSAVCCKQRIRVCKSYLRACSVGVPQQEKCLAASCTLRKESWDEASQLLVKKKKDFH